MTIAIKPELLKKLFAAPEEEQGIDPVVVSSHMKEHLYNKDEPSYLTINNGRVNNDEATKTKKQVEDLCKKMAELGLNNFEPLKDKFDRTNITYVKDVEMLIPIKKVMEGIVYKFDTTPKESKEQLVARYKDRDFACKEGTLTNLENILADLSLGNQGIDAYVTQQVQNFVQQKAIEMKNNGEFKTFIGYRDKDPQNSKEWEIHAVTALVNSVADEYGIKKKSEKDDRYLQAFILTKEEMKVAITALTNKNLILMRKLRPLTSRTDNDSNQIRNSIQNLKESISRNNAELKNLKKNAQGFDGKTILSNALKDSLQDAKVVNAFVDQIAQNVMSNGLPPWQGDVSKDFTFGKNVDENLESLKINDIISQASLLNMKNYAPTGYKQNAPSIISDAVRKYLHDKKVLELPPKEIELAKLRLNLETSVDAEGNSIIAKETLSQASKKELLPEAAKYVSDNNLKLDEGAITYLENQQFQVAVAFKEFSKTLEQEIKRLTKADGKKASNLKEVQQKLNEWFGDKGDKILENNNELLQQVDKIFEKAGEHSNFLANAWNKTVGKVIPALAIKTTSEKKLEKPIKQLKEKLKDKDIAQLNEIKHGLTKQTSSQKSGISNAIPSSKIQQNDTKNGVFR